MDDTTKSIIFILIGLGIVWILIGGPARMKSKDDLFIRPLAPGEEAETYGKIEFGKESKDNEIISIPEQTEQSSVVGSPSTETTTVDENTSPYKGKIEISKSYGSKSDVDQEYIKLKVNNISDEAIQISDWKLRSGITGTETTIGNAVKLPYTSQQNTASAIFVYSRNEIIITTGRSPIGFSFLVNKCSGYLEQFQDFVPNISKQCPLAEDENIPSYELRIFNDECWDFIDSISKCETPSNYPLDMQYECRNYLTTNINYGACLDNHKGDNDFYGNEWRIFLNRSNELWKNNREIIELIDGQGKLVDSYSY